jgi:hypothetical protein
MMMMEKEQPSIYTKIAMNYLDCKEMYSARDVAIARQSPAWNREMLAQYGATTGNVFSTASIDRAVELGKTIDLHTIIESAPKVLGIDPGTTTGVCLCQFANNRCEVLIADEWERIDISDLIERIMAIVNKYQNCKIFCDAAMPLLWTALARQFNEGPDYLEKVKDMIKDGRPQHQIINRYTVHALNFGTSHRQMLQLSKALLDDPDGLVAIHPSQELLIQALRGAIASEWILDKNESPFNHVLDTFRMACTFFRYDYQIKAEEQEVLAQDE